MLSQLPGSYLRVFPHFARCESVLRIRTYDQLSFQFNTGCEGNLCKSRDPPLSTQFASSIHNSIGRAFSCTVALELSNPPFAYAVLADLSFSNGKLLSCSFLRLKVNFCHQDTFVVSTLSPTRQTHPRQTGTPPVNLK